jgi:predicted AAA+ superfamily ATPase
VGDPENNFENRRLISINTSYALDGDIPHLIDEWQEIPPIWDAVRFETDKTSQKGRYILCGSSTPCRKGVMHSGTGRIGTVRMRTMSLFESGNSDGSVSLSGLFNSRFENTIPRKTSLDHLIGLTVRGGWPGTIGMNVKEAATAVGRYPVSVSNNDASRLDGKDRNARKIQMLMRSLARNESTVVSDKTIRRDMKEHDDEDISDVTVAEYVSVLDRLFMLDEQPAFNPNLRSSVRVGKSPKRHLADPSISVAVLELTPKMLFDDLRTYGFMFEAMCERDLGIYSEANGGRLFHYRDSNGREIDAVVEMPDGRWGAFEIKLGTDGIDEAAEKLLKMKKFIESYSEGRPPSVLCVISGLSSGAYVREDGVYVVPITALRE